MLMARAEEPWLEGHYGRDYLDYRAEVPRFFNSCHALAELMTIVQRKSPSFANGPRERR
jgi:hypothetical protein